MDNTKYKKFSSHLVLTARLTGGITIAFSLIYMILSIAAMIFRFTECEMDSTKPFWPLVTSAFIRDVDENQRPKHLPSHLVNYSNRWNVGISNQVFCILRVSVRIYAHEIGNAAVTSVALLNYTLGFIDTVFSVRIGATCIISEANLGITGAYTVFVLATLTLTVSVLCLVSASLLIATLQDEKATRYLNMVVACYIGTNVASLIIDLTTAAHFGMDHSTLTTNLENAMGSSLDVMEIYVFEVLRLGAFILMSVALKGYVGLLINWILMILLIIYVLEHRKLLKTAEHSIHNKGVLNAYDQPRRPDDNSWGNRPNSREPEIFSPFARGAQVNNGFNDDDSDRSPRRPPMRSDTDYSNRSYEHSDSWQRSQSNLPPSARPFSYLEDIKQRGPIRPPPSPVVEAPWTQRDSWQPPQQQGPPVPAPDYSPTPRRLKSALKPGGYM